MCVKCRLDRELSAGRKRIPKGNLSAVHIPHPAATEIDGAACFMCSRFTPAKSVYENQWCNTLSHREAMSGHKRALDRFSGPFFVCQEERFLYLPLYISVCSP